MGNLYEITAELAEIQAQIDEFFDGEAAPPDEIYQEQQELLDALDFKKENFDAKAENYAKLIKNWEIIAEKQEAEAAVVAKEVKRLKERARITANKAGFLSERLKGAMEFLGIAKPIETEIGNIRIKKMPRKVEFDGVARHLPKRLQTQPKAIMPDKNALKKELNDKGVNEIRHEIEGVLVYRFSLEEEQHTKLVIG